MKETKSIKIVNDYDDFDILNLEEINGVYIPTNVNCAQDIDGTLYNVNGDISYNEYGKINKVSLKINKKGSKDTDTRIVMFDENHITDDMIISNYNADDAKIDDGKNFYEVKNNGEYISKTGARYNGVAKNSSIINKVLATAKDTKIVAEHANIEEETDNLRNKNNKIMQEIIARDTNNLRKIEILNEYGTIDTVSLETSNFGLRPSTIESTQVINDKMYNVVASVCYHRDGLKNRIHMAVNEKGSANWDDRTISYYRVKENNKIVEKFDSSIIKDCYSSKPRFDGNKNFYELINGEYVGIKTGAIYDGPAANENVLERIKLLSDNAILKANETDVSKDIVCESNNKTLTKTL